MTMKKDCVMRYSMAQSFFIVIALGGGFYDYLALLGTMQNQHFFSNKQTDKMLLWIRELVSNGDPETNKKKGKAKADASEADMKAEIKKLKQEVEKYKKLQAALDALDDGG